MTKKIRFGVLTFALASLAAAPVSAGTVTYLTSSAYLAAIGAPSFTLDFDTTGVVTTGFKATPFIDANVQFTDSGATSLFVASSFGPGTNNFVTANTSNNIKVTPQSPLGTIYGIGFNLGCYGCLGTAPSSITVDWSDGSTTTYSTSGTDIPNTTNSYWGITSTALSILDVQISYAAPTSGFNQPSLDNIAFTNTAPGGGGGGSPTPEGGSFVLIGAGLAMLALIRRPAAA